MEQLITGFIVSIAGGGIAYLVKFYFSSMEKRISEMEKENNDKMKEMTRKIETLNEAYGKIFNDILSKFSNWEDRIKRLLDDVIREQVQKVSSTKEALELTDVAFKGFDSQTKRELLNIKREVDNLDKSIKSVEKAVNSVHIVGASAATNAFREAISQVNKDLSDIQNKNTEGLDELRDKITILHTVCKSINNDCRRIDEKVKVLAEESKQRIVFK